MKNFFSELILRFINCKNSIKCIHLNVFDVVVYLFKWIPFSVAVGIIIGLVASLFDYMLLLINNFILSSTYILHIFPIFVAFLTALIIHLDSAVAGPGINYILNNMHKKIPIKTIFYKFTVSLFALSGVFIAGREGPSFFMGAGISSYIAKLFNIDKSYRDYIVLIGAGAFTSALLKAPLGGALFAMEIRYVSDMDYKPFPQVLIASVFSYLIFAYFRGESSFITLNLAHTWNFGILPYLMLLGLFSAIIVYIFVIFYHFSNCISSFIKPIKRPVIGVLLAIPIIFLLMNADVHHLLSISVDYRALNDIVQTQMPIQESLLDIALVTLLIGVTIGFGISGGLILPSLLLGALAGNVFGYIFHQDLVIFTIAGMAATLAATAKTPIAAIVLILEISSTDLVIPMTASVIVSYIFTYGINIYESQKVCRIDSKIYDNRL